MRECLHRWWTGEWWRWSSGIWWWRGSNPLIWDSGIRPGPPIHVRNQSGGRISTDLTSSGGPPIQPRMCRKNSDEMINRVRVTARRGFLFSVTLRRRDRQVVVRLRAGQRKMFLCSRIRENSVRFRGRHSTSHQSDDSQHTPRHSLSKVHTNAYTLFTRITAGSHCSTGLSQKQKISYGIKFASMTDGNVEVPVSL